MTFKQNKNIISLNKYYSLLLWENILSEYYYEYEEQLLSHHILSVLYGIIRQLVVRRRNYNVPQQRCLWLYLDVSRYHNSICTALFINTYCTKASSVLQIPFKAGQRWERYFKLPNLSKIPSNSWLMSYLSVI